MSRFCYGYGATPVAYYSYSLFWYKTMTRYTRAMELWLQLAMGRELWLGLATAMELRYGIKHLWLTMALTYIALYISVANSVSSSLSL